MVTRKRFTAYYRWSGTGVETPAADGVFAGTALLHHCVGLFESTLWPFTVAIPMSKPRFSTTRMVSNAVAVEHPVVAAATMPAAAFSSLGQFTTRTVIVRTCDERPFMVNVPSLIPAATVISTTMVQHHVKKPIGEFSLTLASMSDKFYL